MLGTTVLFLIGFAFAGLANEVAYEFLCKVARMPLPRLMTKHPVEWVRRGGQYVNLIVFAIGVVLPLFNVMRPEFFLAQLAMMGVEELIRRKVLKLPLDMFHPQAQYRKHQHLLTAEALGFRVGKAFRHLLGPQNAVSSTRLMGTGFASSRFFQAVKGGLPMPSSFATGHMYMRFPTAKSRFDGVMYGPNRKFTLVPTEIIGIDEDAKPF